MDNKRIEWIDTVKGLAVLMVILGHIIINTGVFRSEQAINVLIYSVHMPIFFFTCGIVFRPISVSEVIKTKAKALLQPTIIFSLVFFIYSVLLQCIIQKSVLLSQNEYLLDFKNIKVILNSVFVTSDSKFSIYWFWPTLFCGFVIFDLVLMIENIILDIVVIAILIALNRVLYFYNIQLPLGLRESLIVIPFLYLGYRLKGILGKISDSSYTKKCRIICLVAIVIYLLECYFWHKSGWYMFDMHNSSIGNVFIFYSISIVGVLAIVSFLIYCTPITKIRPLNYIGKDSLYIYGVHYFFLPLWIYINRYIVDRKIVINIVTKILIDFIGTIIILLCSYAVIACIKGVKGKRNRENIIS